MKKLLFVFALLNVIGAFAEDRDKIERDSNGKIISSTSGGVRRDPNGAILGSKATQANSDGSKTEVKRDANGKIISSKTK